MATFAVLDGNMVVNVIVSDDKESCESELGVMLIEYTEANPAGIGWRFDSETGTFTPPWE